MPKAKPKNTTEGLEDTPVADTATAVKPRPAKTAAPKTPAGATTEAPALPDPPPVLYQDTEPFRCPQWVAKVATFDIDCPEAGHELLVNLQCGQKELYLYFPFQGWIYLDDKPVYVIEFSRPYENTTFTLPVAAAGPHRLRIETELSGCPKALGLSEDLRHLAVQINSAVWRPATRTVRSHSAQVHYPRPRYEAVNNHAEIKPVFVIGAYRSGTSISTWILGQHPNITPTEENTFLIMKYFASIANHGINGLATESFNKIYDLTLRDYLLSEGEHFHHFSLKAARQRTHAKLLESVSGGKSVFDPGFALVRGAYNPKSRWVNGTPEYSTIASGLPDMFPNARMVFMLRRPRDVISSLMRFDAMGQQAQSFEEAAWNWERLSHGAYQAYKTLGPDTVFFADYERLKSDPATLVREWWEFLEEPYFDKAVETTARRINSSGEASAPVEIDNAAIDRLNVIYVGMCSGAPFSSLPWRKELVPFGAVRNHVVDRFTRIITEPGTN